MNSGLRLLKNLRQIRSASTLYPNEKETNTLTLFVSNLPWTVSKRELQQYFAQFGPVSKAEVIFNDKTGLSRGYGYVSYLFAKSYVKALQTKYHTLEGKSLEISQAKNFKKSKNYDADV